MIMKEQESTTDNIQRARRLASRQEGLAEARRLLEAEIRADPSAWEPLDAEVEVLMRLGEEGMALRLLEEYLRYFPECSDASAKLAWLHWEAGRREDALAEARATLARDPNSLTTRLRSIGWARTLNQADLARTLANEGVERFPENAAMWLEMGLCLEVAKKETEAEEAYARALELDPSFEKAALALTKMYAARMKPEAKTVIAPFADRPDATAEALFAGAEVNFRLNTPVPAMQYVHRLALDNRFNEDGLQARVLRSAYNNLGAQGAEKFCFDLIEGLLAVDAFAVLFLEYAGERKSAPLLQRLYKTFSAHPLRYPRAMTRLLSTFSSAAGSQGVLVEWVRNNQQSIEQNPHLWGGVGAWMVYRGKWQEAADHLVRWPGRPGVKPWMILLLGRALEARGRMSEANAQYRAALSFPCDHSEPGLRSRLAFNLAMDGLPANGHIIMMECTKKGREFASDADLLRIYAVEVLTEVNRLDSFEDVSEALNSGWKKMKELAQREPKDETEPIMRAYRRRMLDILAGR